MSALVSSLTGGLSAPPPPPLQQPLLPLPAPPILPQQPLAELQLTEVMAMDVGTEETVQGDELMTDGSGAQQSGSKGPMEDAEVT